MRKTPCTFKDIAGQRFGKWTAIERAENKWGRTTYLCQCDCGNRAIVTKLALEKGRSNSCGCIKNHKNWDRSRETFGKHFTEEEIQRIKDWYPINGCKMLAKFLNRTEYSVRSKAKKLGIQMPHERKVAISRRKDKWSDREIQVMYDHYPTEGIYGCIPLLPKRSKYSIYFKADKLGIKKIEGRGVNNRHTKQSIAA
jgi:hypothetical protein